MAEINIGSPSFKLTHTTEENFVKSICAPFIEEDVNNEMFCFSFLTQSALPNLLQSIKEIDSQSFNNIPKVSKLAVDNFGEEGISVVSNQILPEIRNSMTNSGTKYTKLYTDLYVDTVKAISSKFRDDLAMGKIRKLAASNDFRDRKLAASLITALTDSSTAITQFRSLANDRVDVVRIAIVDALQKCNFDDSFKLYVLSNATRDPMSSVRQHAALIFPEIAPNNIEAYTEMVEDEEVGKYALAGFIAMIKSNSIEALMETFKKACTNFPDDCAALLLDICKIMKPEEEELVMQMCRLLIKNNAFAWHMYEYAEHFENKEPFLPLLSPARARNWRLRYSLQQSTIKFIPIFGEKLVSYVMRYSGDLVAIIRDGAVPLWVELAKISTQAVEKLEWLATKGFKQRLIVAKVITQSEFTPAFTELAKKLANDEVSNVRYCLASRLKDKEMFNLLFANNEDPDIQKIKMQNFN